MPRRNRPVQPARSAWGDAPFWGETPRSAERPFRATQAYGSNGERHPREDQLWQALQRARLDGLFERNALIGGYEVDLVARRQRLIVEVDGFFHYARSAQERDQAKEEVLGRLGYTVIRVQNEEVRVSPDQVVNRIRAALRRPPRPTLPGRM
ncbi:MAG: DUF559 domain-containing protein [Limnochordaceae bacterium]|nr:DUF559 domain-containing protein [Limnochordaceae bacterium]